ncbi:MAG TPA: class I SAM-dependent methyltransferase [Gaiellaceae bacterium]
MPASADRRDLSFDLVAEEYERTRPTYPPEILDVLPLKGSASVVDLGAGTGKLTRLLTARYREVTAVEPLENMRAVLERVVPGARALAGSAEAIPLEDASVDGVFAAQAFHWFEKALALPEIARVLRPEGVLALVWNGPDESRADPRPADFVAEVRALRDAVPRPWEQEPEWEELLAQSGLFREVNRRTTLPHDHVLDREAVLDNLRSISWIASREDREEVVARLGSLLPSGTYAVPNLAQLVWAVRA